MASPSSAEIHSEHSQRLLSFERAMSALREKVAEIGTQSKLSDDHMSRMHADLADKTILLLDKLEKLARRVETVEHEYTRRCKELAMYKKALLGLVVAISGVVAKELAVAVMHSVLR